MGRQPHIWQHFACLFFLAGDAPSHFDEDKGGFRTEWDICFYHTIDDEAGKDGSRLRDCNCWCSSYVERGVGKKQGRAMDDIFKMGLIVLALLGAVIYVSARAMGMDMDVADAVMHLVQLGTDLLNRLFYH